MHEYGIRLTYTFNAIQHTKAYTNIIVDNIASSKGDLSVGFRFKDIICAQEVKIPRVKSGEWGFWDMDVHHPGLEERTCCG